MIRNSIDLTEAVEAAAEGFCADLVPPVTLDNLSAIQRHVVREQALSYVTHALPHIERQVREQVAREMYADALNPERGIPFDDDADVVTVAAWIEEWFETRGDQS